MILEKDGIAQDIIRWKNMFLREKKGINCSNNTISTYDRQLIVFSDFCEEISEETSLKTIKQMHISYFFAWLDERIGAKNNTKAGYLRTLKSFFSFLTKNNDDLVDFDYLFKNFRLKLKKGEKKELNFIDNHKMDRILEFLERKRQKTQNYINNRNSLLIKLMFGAGLRISEALNLKVCDFTTKDSDDEFYELSILAKGGEIQTAYILKSLIKDEVKYIFDKLDLDSFIFLTVHNTKLLRQTAYRVIKNIYQKSGVFKSGCHILRHSFAMDLVRKDVNLSVIQKLMRHKNVATTMIYAEGSPEMMKEALKK